MSSEQPLRGADSDSDIFGQPAGDAPTARQVLEYFDAFLIGLTATPSKQTIGFFFGNLVMEHPYRRAGTDGVNVEGEVYRIRTKITSEGATLDAEPHFYVLRRDRRTRKKRYAELDDDLTYTANQLDRDVVSEQQIRLVMKSAKDAGPCETRLMSVLLLV